MASCRRTSTSSRTNRFECRPRPFRKGTGWSTPHDGRDRIVVLLDKTNQSAETNERDSLSSSAWRVTLIPTNSDINMPNNSDQTKNLNIIEFKDAVAEQALVRTKTPRRKARQ